MVVMERESAILHGAFLLSDKLCQPTSLSCLPKTDWSRVGQPILKALQEAGGGPLSSSLWTKKLLTAVWLKVLCRDNDEDVEMSWRENPLFALQNGLPELNHVVLLELVKSLSAADVFAQLLLCLPDGDMCVDLERMAQHVVQSPTSEQDVRLFLDVWWALWRGRSSWTDGEENIEEVFSAQFALLTHKPTGGTSQAAKRIRLDSSMSSEPTLDVLRIFFHTLNTMKSDISSSELCFTALAICLDVLCTSFLIKEAVVLPVKKKLSILSAAIKEVKNVRPQLIQELLCDLSAAHRPAQFRPKQMTLSEGLKMVLDLLNFWLQSGLLSVNEPSSSACKLQYSAQRLLEALDEPFEATDLNTFKDLLKSLKFPAVEINPEVSMAVAISVISHCLDDYRSFAQVFAAEESWAGCEDHWIDCLEQNQAAFQEQDTVINLVTILSAKIHSSAVTQCRRMLKVITDIFSALPLEDKNKALASVIAVSDRGFFRVPSALSEAFEKELNMAFNCMIQGGRGAKASQGNLDTAVSLVARVAFQNPEAAVRSCCQAAVFNKGAFVLMAKILQKLPGLRRRRDSEDAIGGSLLCWCLQESIRSRSMTTGEKEQLVQFLSLLMRPVESEEEPFMSPQEVVNTFVLPNISGSGNMSVDQELGLQLLHAALHLEAREPPRWLLECHAFPLLFVLAQLQHQTRRWWEQPAEGADSPWSMDSKELLGSLLSRLAELVGAEAEVDPSSWSRALFWLHDKVECLDWTVGLLLKPVWGEHFKKEVPSSLLSVCDLPEQEWSDLELPEYGPGTGLLAWMECSSLSDSLQATMLSTLSLDQRQAGHLSMFSKGVLVALTQVLPCCTASQWTRLLGTVKELISTGRLHVPFSLEYVDFLPLLDLKSFSCELCISVLLLRVFQLLCGSSCGGWLEAEGWAHVGRLYALAVRDVMDSLRAKLPLPAHALSTQPPAAGEERSQEVLFVLSQLFCHVQHVQVMMPGGQCEPLFLSSLEIISHYEAVMAAFPASCSALESLNTKHFLSTITDNLENKDMAKVLQQKIAQIA